MLPEKTVTVRDRDRLYPFPHLWRQKMKVALHRDLQKVFRRIHETADGDGASSLHSAVLFPCSLRCACGAASTLRKSGYRNVGLPEWVVRNPEAADAGLARKGLRCTRKFKFVAALLR